MERDYFSFWISLSLCLHSYVYIYQTNCNAFGAIRWTFYLFALVKKRPAITKRKGDSLGYVLNKRYTHKTYIHMCHLSMVLMKRLLLKIETHTSHYVFIKCPKWKGYSSAFLFMLCHMRNGVESAFSPWSSLFSISFHLVSNLLVFYARCTMDKDTLAASWISMWL